MKLHEIRHVSSIIKNCRIVVRVTIIVKNLTENRTVKSNWSMLQQTANSKDEVSVTELKQKFVRIFSVISIQMGHQAVCVRRALCREYFPPF